MKIETLIGSAVVADWKADPADVIEQVNRVLNISGSRRKFQLVETDDDQFVFDFVELT